MSCSKRVFAVGKGKTYLSTQVKSRGWVTEEAFSRSISFNLLYLVIIYSVCVYARVWLFKGVRSYLRKLVFYVCWVGSELCRRVDSWCCSFWAGFLSSPDSLLIYDPIFACPFIRVPAVWRGRFSSQKKTPQRSGKGKGGDGELCRRKGKEVVFFLALAAAGRAVCGAGLSPPSTAIRGFPRGWIRPGVFFPPRGRVVQRGRAGPGSPGPGCLWGAPRGVPPSLARVGEGRRGLFYLRRGAGSGREGKVQAAGGRAPLSPMEGV